MYQNSTDEPETNVHPIWKMSSDDHFKRALGDETLVSQYSNTFFEPQEKPVDVSNESIDDNSEKDGSNLSQDLLKCDKCQKTFKNEKGLKIHIGRAHSRRSAPWKKKRKSAENSNNSFNDKITLEESDISSPKTELKRSPVRISLMPKNKRVHAHNFLIPNFDKNTDNEEDFEPPSKTVRSDDGIDEDMNMEATDDQLESHSESKSLKIKIK